MRHWLIAAALLAAPAVHAQTVRVGAPVGVPGAPGAAGAIGAAPTTGPRGSAPGSLMQLPVNGLMPLPVFLAPAPLTPEPANAAAGAQAATPARPGAARTWAPRSETRPIAPQTPARAGAVRDFRQDLVPPEDGLLRPSATPAKTRQPHRATVPNIREPAAAAVRGEETRTVASAVRRLRLIDPWLRSKSAADDFARSLDATMGGHLAAGAAGRELTSAAEPRSAAYRASSSRGAAWSPAGESSRLAEGHAAAAGSYRSDAGSFRPADLAGAPAPAARGTRNLSSPAGGSASAGLPLAAMTARPSGADAPATAADTGAPEAATASAPRLLRLGLPPVPPSASGLALRIFDAPARPRALEAADVQAAALALGRRDGPPATGGDRILAETSLPPLPAPSTEHGWLAYWTAAAASRILIARAF